jgi:hypothetical protein
VNLATEFATGRDSTGLAGSGTKNVSGPRKARQSTTFQDSQGKPGQARSNFKTGALNRSATHPGLGWSWSKPCRRRSTSGGDGVKGSPRDSALRVPGMATTAIDRPTAIRRVGGTRAGPPLFQDLPALLREEDRVRAEKNGSRLARGLR